MALINGHFLELEDSYLFSTVNKKVAAFGEAHPEKKIIRMGIGDVTLPLAPAVIDALHQAVDEMATKEGFHGYGPEQGYDFLRGAVRDYYKTHGVELEADEIFISDGAKSDIGNITDLFDGANTVMIPDPVYPVYVDTNIMDGRTILYLSATPENDFLPMPDGRHADLVYLWTTPWKTRRCCCLTRPMNPSSPMRNCRTASMRWRAPKNAPSNSAPFPRRPASPAPAAAIPWCPRRFTAKLLPVKRCSPTACGCAARPPSLTACPTSSSGAQRRSSPRRGGRSALT